MDDIVRQALAKWPNVPHCHGWLGLDARGDWYMRDDRVQRAGPFPAARGSRIEHPMLLRFIERNYACDAAGGWFFQNGPQRVYVDLEAAPWVWRLAEGTERSGPSIAAHTGAVARYRAAWLDEAGRLFLETDLGLGLVHTLDMEAAADAVERCVWRPGEIAFDAMPERFGYRRVPRPASGDDPEPVPG